MPNKLVMLHIRLLGKVTWVTIRKLKQIIKVFEESTIVQNETLHGHSGGGDTFALQHIWQCVSKKK